MDYNALKALLVRGADGEIDVEASVNRFRNAVIVAKEKVSADLTRIAEAVSAVFDQYKGAHIQIDAIKSMALQRLNVHHTVYTEIGDRVHKYVQEHTADSKREDGLTVHGVAPLFVLRKGKHGGFARLSDQEAKPAETANA